MFIILYYWKCGLTQILKPWNELKNTFHTQGHKSAIEYNFHWDKMLDLFYKYSVVIFIKKYSPNIYFYNYVQITIWTYDDSDRTIREIKTIWINQIKLSVEKSSSILKSQYIYINIEM